MTQLRTRWAQRLTAVAGALTLGLVGVAAPAAAQVTDPNIDPEQTGSLTIQKFAEPETATGLPNDGTEVDTAGLDPLEGIEFTIEQVGDYDLTTEAGWEAIDGMTPAQAADEPLTQVGVDTTAADGQVTFSDLELGLYLVTETGHGDHLVPNEAAPFLVTVPMPHATQGWLYDIYAYPKNSVTAIDKTLDDTGAYGLGDTITWTITADVPQLPDGEELTEFAMSDALDENLEFQELRVTDSAGTVEPANYDTNLDETTNTLTATFTAAGLASLQANQGTTVTFEIDTAVTGIGTGTITNVANIAINGWDADTDPIDGSAWGSLDIFKYTGSEQTPDALADAQFQIFTTEEDANNLTNPVAVNGSETFTTQTDGIAAVDGLRAGTYWVVETQAPAGYTGLADPMTVTIEAGDDNLLQVQNEQRAGFELPLTGGIGTWVFVLVGVGVIALGIGLAIAHQRRKKTA
jgi:fimbrial isopeptide formation D2 family protein/LPXTG-motif cell wall-anchored protein